jgi:elongation factor P--beta-lysine ligase
MVEQHGMVFCLLWPLHKEKIAMRGASRMIYKRYNPYFLDKILTTVETTVLQTTAISDMTLTTVETIVMKSTATSDMTLTSTEATTMQSTATSDVTLTTAETYQIS